MQIQNPEFVTQHTMAGNTLGNIANRISYCFDWSSFPSLPFSLIILGMALRSRAILRAVAVSRPSISLFAVSRYFLSFLCFSSYLKCGDCETAVVIGVNSLLSPGPYIGFSQVSPSLPTPFLSLIP